ncbi:MAG TPA: SMP-30/gluconolactonase/LRE family protein [Treponemataceae bacterium]|nr:SMP-30/gluconolactonase/LRE family protein [Treponemataceae bacterium]
MKKRILVPVISLILGAVLIWLVCMFANLEKSKNVTIDISTLGNVQWLTGITAPENILLSNTSSDFYVTDLHGFIHRVKKDEIENEYVVKDSQKIGKSALGLAWANDLNTELFVGVCLENWPKPGGSVFKMSSDLQNIERISNNYSGLNGFATDAHGELYIATSNFNMLYPKGSIINIGGKTGDTLVTKTKAVNGLFYDDKTNSLFYSEVFTGISQFDFASETSHTVLGKSKILEGFDDFCIDSQNNLWIADPPSNLIKMYWPDEKIVYHIKIEGFGVASSCRIRHENGEDYIFITELNKVNYSKTDGRGVLILPLKELVRFL